MKLNSQTSSKPIIIRCSGQKKTLHLLVSIGLLDLFPSVVGRLAGRAFRQVIRRMGKIYVVTLHPCVSQGSSEYERDRSDKQRSRRAHRVRYKGQLAKSIDLLIAWARGRFSISHGDLGAFRFWLEKSRLPRTT